MKFKTNILDEKAIKRTTIRLSHEIIERNKGAENLALIGIKTRGIPFAQRIANGILSVEGVKVPVGKLDITLYRDDLSTFSVLPTVNETLVDFDVNGKTVILCDDVIFTGRTARAAIDALLKLGRPKSIQLAIMVDRGHRELPIRPDFVGKNLPTSLAEVVCVKFTETDGVTAVDLYEK
ncbi:MAG: bifunctional pyr operon transcriptional regulator/uracil phosphoribosyltransferase PyrR [Clostridia bacterium]|nr:bifunctional pyr operon transcriptional regulator/uracil phosphoribosyltransferase PyrR [Clostridia bacterium]